MVRAILLSAALLTLSTSVAAAPTTDPTANIPFTISKWIEDIFAEPNGKHLTPAEAVAAADEAHASGNPLTKRVNCHDTTAIWPRANANDAAACLADLARKGAAGVGCAIPADRSDIQMCRIGNAQIVSSRGFSGHLEVNCNDIARTGGLIFDSCYRADNTIKGSEICISDRRFQVNLLGV